MDLHLGLSFSLCASSWSASVIMDLLHYGSKSEPGFLIRAYLRGVQGIIWTLAILGQPFSFMALLYYRVEPFIRAMPCPVCEAHETKVPGTVPRMRLV